MDPSETSENDGIGNIKKSFAQHRAAVEDAGAHPEGRTAGVAGAEPINTGVTTTPKKRPQHWKRQNTGTSHQILKTRL